MHSTDEAYEDALTGRDPSAQAGTDAEHLNSRYGLHKKNRFDKKIAYALGAVLTVTLGWFAYSMVFGNTFGTVSTSDIAHSITGDNSAEITFEVATAKPAVTLECEVHALSSSYAPLGYKILRLDPSARQVRRITTTIRTISRANTITVTACWEAR